MRITAKVEREIIAALTVNPDACITLDAARHQPNGSIPVYRDNLSTSLHRRLYQLLVADLPRSTYLLPTCRTWGCANPWHREASNRPQRGRVSSRCINGHEYTPENTLPGGRDRCKTCRDARLARRRKTDRQRGYCMRGHKIAGKNVYETTDVRGKVHRRCRKCKLAAVRAQRNGERND